MKIAVLDVTGSPVTVQANFPTTAAPTVPHTGTITFAAILRGTGTTSATIEYSAVIDDGQVDSSQLLELVVTNTAPVASFTLATGCNQFKARVKAITGNVIGLKLTANGV